VLVPNGTGRAASVIVLSMFDMPLLPRYFADLCDGETASDRPVSVFACWPAGPQIDLSGVCTL
jgi:hypothetical protein